MRKTRVPRRLRDPGRNRGGRLRHRDGSGRRRGTFKPDPPAGDHHTPCETPPGAAIGRVRSTRRRRARRAAAPRGGSRRDLRAVAGAQRRERLGLRMPRCGGTGSAPNSRRAGSVNGPVRPHAQAARPLALRGRPESSRAGMADCSPPSSWVASYRVVVGGLPDPGTVMMSWVIATRAPRISATVSTARMSARMTRRLPVVARCAGGRRGHSCGRGAGARSRRRWRPTPGGR